MITSIKHAACRYLPHAADWSPDEGLYAYAAHNSVVLLDTRHHAVRGILRGHTNRQVARLASPLGQSAVHTRGTGSTQDEEREVVELGTHS